jgi:hypothetical protein
MNDPLNLLIEAATAVYIYRKTYRADAERTVYLLKKVRNVLARVEWELYPDLQCVSEVAHTWETPEQPGTDHAA